MNFQLSLEKKINKFGQKAKILEKNENAHEIRKKRAGLCPGVMQNEIECLKRFLQQGFRKSFTFIRTKMKNFHNSRIYC